MHTLSRTAGALPFTQARTIKATCTQVKQGDFEINLSCVQDKLFAIANEKMKK